MKRHDATRSADPRESPLEERRGLAVTMSRLFGANEPAPRAGRFVLLEGVEHRVARKGWPRPPAQLESRVALELLCAFELHVACIGRELVEHGALVNTTTECEHRLGCRSTRESTNRFEESRNRIPVRGH